MATDPYLDLETREKEDAFLRRVLETIREGLNHAAPANAADTLLHFLQSVQPQMSPGVEVPQHEQQEAEDMALDLWTAFDTNNGHFDAMSDEINTRNQSIRYQVSRICAGNLHLVLLFAVPIPIYRKVVPKLNDFSTDRLIIARKETECQTTRRN